MITGLLRISLFCLIPSIIEAQNNIAPAQTLQSNHPMQGAMFGFDVDASNDILCVGAPSDSAMTTTGVRSCGSVYVFRKEAGQWRLSQRLVPPKNITGKHLSFGRALALSDSFLIVTDYKYRSQESKNHGIVHVYKLTATDTFDLFKTVTPPSSDYKTLGFGTNVAASKPDILICSPSQDNYNGAVYAFEIKSRDIILKQKLSIENNGLMFGGEISMNGQNAIISSERANRNGVFLFHKSAHLNQWKQIDQTFETRSKVTEFGYGNGLYEDIAAVSSDDRSSLIHIYRLGTGIELDTFLSLSPSNVSNSPNTLAINSDYIAVGLFDDLVPFNQKEINGGRVVVFKNEGKKWRQILDLPNPNMDDGSKFGYALKIVDRQLIVTCRRCDVEGVKDAGVVHIYSLNK